MYEYKFACNAPHKTVSVCAMLQLNMGVVTHITHTAVRVFATYFISAFLGISIAHSVFFTDKFTNTHTKTF